MSEQSRPVSSIRCNPAIWPPMRLSRAWMAASTSLSSHNGAAMLLSPNREVRLPNACVDHGCLIRHGSRPAQHRGDRAILVLGETDRFLDLLDAEPRAGGDIPQVDRGQHA